jgi:hypothetical protein
MNLMKQVNIKTILFACFFLCCHNATYGIRLCVSGEFFGMSLGVEIDEECTVLDLERRIMASVHKECIGSLIIKKTDVILERDKKLSFYQLGEFARQGLVLKVSLESERDRALYELKIAIEKNHKKDTDVPELQKRINNLKKTRDNLMNMRVVSVGPTSYLGGPEEHRKHIEYYENNMITYSYDYLESAYKNFQKLNDKFLAEKEAALAKLEGQVSETRTEELEGKMAQEKKSLDEICAKVLEAREKYSEMMKTINVGAAGIHASSVAASAAGGGSGSASGGGAGAGAGSA